MKPLLLIFMHFSFLFLVRDFGTELLPIRPQCQMENDRQKYVSKWLKEITSRSGTRAPVTEEKEEIAEIDKIEKISIMQLIKRGQQALNAYSGFKNYSLLNVPSENGKHGK